ncbi:hypothetical protein DXG01_017029 [Tephrocybe rancida]|nr:hypothetical protein DXG01_017029 [Tephrocybe rancida]
MSNSKAQAAKEKVGSRLYPYSEFSYLKQNQGNAAFKAGQYPDAIGHYTAAILADGKDHTFPLNRAAAYLKLGKNEDVERDCTTVLRLSALNAKALFRRGQARLAMGRLEDASTDLKEALNREPTNAAIKEELRKATESLERGKAKTPRTSTTPSSASPAPKRRRVPINIVDATEAAPTPVPSPPEVPIAASPSSSQAPKKSQVESPPISATSITSPDTLKPVSTRSLKPESSTPSPPKPTRAPAPAAPQAPVEPTPEPPRTFKDAKQARESVKPSRVGGGIFRKTGESTVFPTRSSPVAAAGRANPQSAPGSAPTADAPQLQAAPAPARIAPVVPEKPPKTLFDFTRAWDSEKATAARWGLVLVRDISLCIMWSSFADEGMQSIPPANIPALFKTSLEPALLTSILKVFQEVLKASRSDAETLREYMDAFTKVERFGTVVLFLSRAEKEVARGLWEGLGVTKEGVAKVWAPVWG